MRLDLFLKAVCLVKQRSLAKKACDAGKIRIGGRALRASHQTREGEILTIRFPRRTITLEVLAIPSGQVAKSEGGSYYRILSEERLEDDG